ncbi:MBL fold metallo-hydrolase [Streptomyces anulatus]|uniref:MBL fold metallo-hydrolase n=1 Tax=Streptomyces anulatus TaxID=1892 RepID=UPI00224CB085|nr:MBL fold metallo-hydrolase [Streptomyces anulatus]MCX4486832.1 MBL fold metallo-hydrolase [Streptomyces anulatus]
MSREVVAETVEIADGVHAYVQKDGSWFLNNTGFINGGHGVTSIDTCATERRTRAYLDAISAITRDPVRTLVNTHHHSDHTFGNHLIPGATIVGHEQTRVEIQRFGGPSNRGVWNDVEWGEFALAPPFLTYTTGVTLWSDDLRCDVRYVGTPAHTTNDSIVHLPDRSVLFAGDLLFKGGTPFALMGSLTGTIDVLENVVRPLGARTIVCGHGPVCGPEVIDEMLAYLRFVQDLARRAKAAGLTPLEAARESDLGSFAGLLDAERIVGNLHRAYAELDGAEAGERIDNAAAYRDMIAYNGGRPLTSHA